MIVGGGILYEEFYFDVFVKCGGVFEMVQLWVNLLVKDKMIVFGYQVICSEIIFQVVLFEGVGSLCVIVGDYVGKNGFVNIFLLLNVWDIWLN